MKIWRSFLILLLLTGWGRELNTQTKSSGREASLRGSRASMRLQTRKMKQYGYSRFRQRSQMVKFLTRLRSGEYYTLDKQVTYPYARPEVGLFLRRMSEQFYHRCGEKLVVTSLARTIFFPGGRRSVHPAGMATDLRVPEKWQCQIVLESILLTLEGEGVIEATREWNEPHFHVAIFPEYPIYVKRLELAQAGNKK